MANVVGPVRTRRIAAGLVLLSGLVAIATAFTNPVAARLTSLVEVVPIEVPLVANGLTVAFGTVLVVLSVGLARGQRRAHRLVMALLAVLTLSHLVKGIDVEEASLAFATLMGLVVVRRSFSAHTEMEGAGHRALIVLGGLGVAVIVAALGLALQDGVVMVDAVGQAVRDLGGASGGSGADRFVAAALSGLGIGGLLAVAVTFIARPQRDGRAASDDVRQTVLSHGTDSLAYFALRDDKLHHRHGETVVAYGVFGRVALVSPDPVGPPAELDAAMRDFMSWAHGEGLVVAVLAAAEGPAERYRSMGLRTIYLGDEAVVRFDNLELVGRRFKGLRSAVSRAERAGYHMEYLDPSALTEQQQTSLGPLVDASRQGDVERGFSMTLSRLFDPRDTGLLLAVAVNEEGEPGAFCQFVPSADVGGWSLDVMRRATDIPNGLIDYVIVSTMRHVAAEGGSGLGLNFATMRSVVDPETEDEDAGNRLVQAEKFLLHQLSESFQIESLFRFNEKFAPEWRPRFLVYERLSQLPEIGVAVARAESFWEIPVVGRFLVPETPVPTEGGIRP